MTGFGDVSGTLWVCIALAVVLFCCGGDGDGVVPVDNALTDNSCVRWIQPGEFEDNTTLDPFRDIREYQIATRSVFSEDRPWDGGDVKAVVVPVWNDNGVTRISDSFDLYLIRHYVDNDSQFVTVRSVSTEGAESGFGDPALWER